MTLVLATVSPMDYTESIATLRFASRTRSVLNAPKVNFCPNPQQVMGMEKLYIIV
jgi:hypothetical protein